MGIKKHFKMYKSGKLWVSAAIVSFSVMTGVVVNSQTVKADQNSDTSTANQVSELSNNDIANRHFEQGLSGSSIDNNNDTVDNNIIVNGSAHKENINVSNNIGEKKGNEYTKSVSNLNDKDKTDIHDNVQSNNTLTTRLYSYQSNQEFNFDQEIANSGSGAGNRDIYVEDPVHPGLITYYYFDDYADNLNISKHAFKTVVRKIYVKNPENGDINCVEDNAIYFNRWVTIDTNNNNQLIDCGPWILATWSSKSFPAFTIPQKDGYISLCNGEPATIIYSEGDVSSNSPDETDYVITYKDTQHVTRTINIEDPFGQKTKVIQQATRTGENNNWPEYLIPQYSGYTSYLNEKKSSKVPEIIVNGESQDIDVYITYKQIPDIEQRKEEHETITRTIKITDPDGNVKSLVQDVKYARNVTIITNYRGEHVYAYGNWVLDYSGDNWPEYYIPQYYGYDSYVNGEKLTKVPEKKVNEDTNNQIVNVSYKMQIGIPVKYKEKKTIKRIINIINPQGEKQSFVQNVSFNRNTTVENTGSSLLNFGDGDWQLESSSNTWPEFIIPQINGYISYVDNEISNKIDSKTVFGDDHDQTINVIYRKAIMETGEIDYVDENNIVIKTENISGRLGTIIPIKINLPEGYELVSGQNIPSTIQVEGDEIPYINVRIQKIINYSSSNEVPQDTTTLNNNYEFNHGNLDSYSLTEDSNGQIQMKASGWHATGHSNSNSYRYVIVYDNTRWQEIAREKIVPITRNDVREAYLNVDNSNYSGFNFTVNIPDYAINDSLSLVSRYSNDSTNGEGEHVDYWFGPLNIDKGNYASLDQINTQNGHLSVSGWHASNQATRKKYHYIIEFDKTKGREINRQLVQNGNYRPDVANAYSTIANASQSGFKVEFTLQPNYAQDKIQFISRWTDDPAGNGNAVDYWFNPITEINRGNLDSYDVSDGCLHVAGWHANDVSLFEPYHFLILFDQTTGQQVTSALVPTENSSDVANVYGHDTRSAGKSRFDYQFSKVNLISGHQYVIISRYSAVNEGNGDDGSGNHTDYWYPSLNLNYSEKASNLDSIQVNNNKLSISGWFADNSSLLKPYAYIILLNDNNEIGRQKISFTSRPDVDKVYPHIINSSNSGFNVNFDLPEYKLGNLRVVLRYTDDPSGNGSTSDTWINIPQYMIKHI